MASAQPVASKWAEKKSWGDETEDGDSKDQKGEKGVVRTLEPIYRRNDAGQMVKITKKVRTVVQKVRVNKNVAMRRKWAKFGDCKGQPPGIEEGVTDFDRAVIVLDLRARKREEKNDVDDPLAKLGQVGGSVVICRNCGETGHWTLKCPRRGAPPAGSSPGDSSSSKSASSSTATPGKYVPVHQREGPKRTGVTMLRDETAALRVTNLSEDTTEQDLADLFRMFGHTSRIYLAKDRKNNQSRGFAFINFTRREDAQRAIEKLDGHPYAHLILRVEWAKPREEREDDGAPPPSSSSSSGGRGFGPRRM